MVLFFFALVRALDSSSLLAPGRSKAADKVGLKCSVTQRHLYVWPVRLARKTSEK